MLIEQARPDSMIVFTTAYDEYAVRAFAVNSIDYLLKPIHQERLLQTIERFESLTAVSYTHLDVYKRQFATPPRRCFFMYTPSRERMLRTVSLGCAPFSTHANAAVA